MTVSFIGGGNWLGLGLGEYQQKTTDLPQVQLFPFFSIL